MSQKPDRVLRPRTTTSTGLSDTADEDWSQTRLRLRELARPVVQQTRPPPRRSLPGEQDPFADVQPAPSEAVPLGSRDRPVLLLDSSPEPTTITTTTARDDSDSPVLKRRKRRRREVKRQMDLSLHGLLLQHEEEKRRVLGRVDNIIRKVEREADEIINSIRPDIISPYMPETRVPRLVEFIPGEDPVDDPVFAPRTDAREDYQQVAWFSRHSASSLWNHLKFVLRNLPHEKSLYADVMRRTFAAFANRLRYHLDRNPNILRTIAAEHAMFGTHAY